MNATPTMTTPPTIPARGPDVPTPRRRIDLVGLIRLLRPEKPRPAQLATTITQALARMRNQHAIEQRRGNAPSRTPS